MLEFVLFGSQVIDPAAEEFKMFLEVGVGAEIESIERCVGAGNFAGSGTSVGSVESIAHISEERADKSGIVENYGHLLEDIFRFNEMILPRIAKMHGLIGDSVALKDEIAMRGLHGIVENDDGIGTEFGLVR